MTNQEASKVIKDGIDDMSLDYFDEEQYEALTMAIKALEQEPNDKYIKEIDHLRKYISKLETQIVEQEPSGDLISRQAVIDLIEHYNSDGLGSVFYGYENGVKFADAVNKLPSVNPQEPKTGHWEYKEIANTTITGYWCNQCHIGSSKPYDYCPNCGCAMKGESE